MDIREIYDDNVSEYSSIIDPDVAENMERMYYRGLACHDDDDSVKAAMIWELKAVEKDTDTQSRIDWVYTDGPDHLAAMLNAYKEQMTEDEVKRSFFEIDDMDEKTSAAFGENGFKTGSVESKGVYLTLDECKALPMAGKKVPSFVNSLSELALKEYHQGIMKIMFHPDVTPMEDLCYIPKTWFDPDVSCYVTTDNMVNGFLLIHRFPSGTLLPVLYYATGPDFTKHLGYMMVYSIQKAAAKYPGDTKILVRRRAKHVAALVQKLFPGKKGGPAVAGLREE